MIFACTLHRQYCKIKHCNKQQACAGALTTKDSKFCQVAILFFKLMKKKNLSFLITKFPKRDLVFFIKKSPNSILSSNRQQKIQKENFHILFIFRCQIFVYFHILLSPNLAKSCYDDHHFNYITKLKNKKPGVILVEYFDTPCQAGTGSSMRIVGTLYMIRFLTHCNFSCVV